MRGLQTNKRTPQTRRTSREASEKRARARLLLHPASQPRIWAPQLPGGGPAAAAAARVNSVKVEGLTVML